MCVRSPRLHQLRSSGSTRWDRVSQLCSAAPSDAEALPAATRPLDVGVVEHELSRKLGVHEVHLGAQQGELGLLLDEHPHAWRTASTQLSHCTGAVCTHSRY